MNLVYRCRKVSYSARDRKGNFQMGFAPSLRISLRTLRLNFNMQIYPLCSIINWSLLSITLLFFFANAGFAQSNPESKIINKIQQLPEVKKASAALERRTNGKRHIKYVVYERPSKEFKYYWVKVMEDNGEMYVSDFNFYINPKTLSIKYLDTDNDSVMDLKTWRKRYKK